MTGLHLSTTDSSTAFVYSHYGDDPDLGELVELFVEEMPDRIQVLLTSAEQRDWSELSRVAHQLKGAAGSYGFMQITPLAQQLELAARLGSDEQHILQMLEQVVQLCRLCRPGVPR